MKKVGSILGTVLLLSQLVLPLTSITELQIQNVNAAESSNMESPIDKWMPDKNLQSIIANKLGTTDFSQDDMLSIEDLSIDNSEITDLSGLSYAKNLKVLSITNTDLSATKNLADITKIETLTDIIATNDNLSSMSVFNSTEMSSLINLDLSYNSFTSLDSFKGLNLPVLKKINISNNKFENVDAYDSLNLPELEDIDASHNNISDISSLLTSSQAASIKTIDASFNNFQSLNSVTGINLPNLESLDMSNNVLSDISILQTAKVPKLTYLKASYNKIADITPIANSSITSLTELIVDHNQIKDIDAFKTSSFTNLENLDVSYNQIEDISIMENLNDRYPKLSTYKVDNNKISNLKFMNGYSLKDNTSASNQSYNENITLIKPTSGLKSIDMPIVTSNFIYNSSTGLYLGTPDPEGNTLTIFNVQNVDFVTKYDGTTISFADGNNESGTGIKTFEVDSSSLPENITFDWSGAQGAFSGSGIININWIDAIAPIIDANDKTIEQGSSFDPLKDITAFDQQNDGTEKKDLSSSIKVVNNSVDTSKPGLYKVEYFVTNSFNISTTKSINVTVKAKAEDPVAGKNVTVKYQDTKGNQIHPDIVKSGNIDDLYTTEQLKINNYTFKEVKGNPKGSFTDKEQTVTYIYTKNSPKDPVVGKKVTMKYQDANGKQIHPDVVESGNIGQLYGIKPLIIEGYYLVDIQGDPVGFFTDQEQTVIYIYKKIELGLPSIPKVTPSQGTTVPTALPTQQSNNGIPSAGNNTLPQSNTPITDGTSSKQYPATGEKQSNIWVIIGVILLIALGGFYWFKKNKEKNEH